MANNPVNRGRRSDRRGRGFLRSQSGQSLVEVALLTPLLLAMVLGAIEIGRYAYISILVGNAAHAGALYGSQSLANSVSPNITLAAQNDFQNNGQKTGNLNVTYNDSCGCDNGGTLTYLGQLTSACLAIDATTACPGSNNHWVVMVSVTASGTFQSLFNYPWIPSSITVTRTSSLRVNQQ
jgi:Flp pilus assembly protein TadG